MGSQVGRYSKKMTGGKPPIPNVKNGRIPVSKLGRCVTQTRAEYPFLYAPAARAFDDMTRAATKDGVKIEAIALYRDFDGQVEMKRIWTARGKPQNAATPGRSNHGWGTAADINRTKPGVLKWLVQNGPRFGWDHPMWAGGAAGPEAGPEPWHWQFIQGFVSKTETPIFVFGKLIEEADAFMDDGTNWVAVRPVATALNAIVKLFREVGGEEEAFIDGPNGLEGWIPFRNVDGVGYSPIGKLATLLGKRAVWDGKSVRVD